MMGLSGGLIAHAQDLEEEFASHLSNIALALSDWEKDLQNLKSNYEKLSASYAEMEKQYNTTSSWLEKTKLKVKLTLTKRQVNKSQTTMQKKRLQLYIYYAVLESARRYNLSSEQRAEAKQYIAELQKMEGELEQKIRKAQENAEAARKRLDAIPQEISEAEGRVESLKKQIQVLEDKKSWGNLTERLELKGKLSWQQGKLLKLKGEIIVQQKLRVDALIEEKSGKLEKKEVEIALRILGN
jgi:chromosome segregation ATPase